MYRILIQGSEEEPIVFEDATCVELVKDVDTLENVRDVLDRINIRTRNKREFFMAIRKARIYIQAEAEIFQAEAEDSSWAVMYWKK